MQQQLQRHRRSPKPWRNWQHRSKPCVDVAVSRRLVCAWWVSIVHDTNRVVTQELDALQATIDDLHRQMETIEEDLRKRVAQEHAAAIQAERDEADRRVAAKQTEVEEFKQLYAKEARQRKVIHNKLLELQYVDLPPPPAHVSPPYCMVTLPMCLAQQGQHPGVCQAATYHASGAKAGA